MTASTPVSRRPATRGREALDDAWDTEMTGLLRAAAEIREERDLARLSEDTLLAQRETAALLDAIRTRRRPSVKHYVLRRPARLRGGPHGVIA